MDRSQRSWEVTHHLEPRSACSTSDARAVPVECSEVSALTPCGKRNLDKRLIRVVRANRESSLECSGHLRAERDAELFCFSSPDDERPRYLLHREHWPAAGNQGRTNGHRAGAAVPERNVDSSLLRREFHRCCGWSEHGRMRKEMYSNFDIFESDEGATIRDSRACAGPSADGRAVLRCCDELKRFTFRDEETRISAPSGGSSCCNHAGSYHRGGDSYPVGCR